LLFAVLCQNHNIVSCYCHEAYLRYSAGSSCHGISHFIIIVNLQMDFGALNPHARIIRSNPCTRVASDQVHHSPQSSLRVPAKQSRAAEGSSGRDCFVAQGAPRNDSANLIEV
jgi:hypothetical protein